MNFKLHVEAHLSEEVLIRSLDGELDKRASETAVRHLDACWSCRSRREQLRLAMDRFVHLEEALIDPSITTPPRAWAGFREQLNLMASTAEPARSRPMTQMTQALGMIGAAVAIAVWLMPTTSVSAMEILERSAASERPVFQTRNPLVLQRLRVESERRTAAWSLWTAPQARKFQQLWDSAHDDHLRADLEQIYAANGLDMEHPLSASNHSRWRRMLKEHKDSVLRQGELIGVLTVSDKPVKAGEISEAELWVRISDWHPVTETFRIAGEGAPQDYRIVETAFRVEALDAENARVFDAAPVIADPALSRAHLAVPAAEGSGASEMPSPVHHAGLIEAEIEALALLHEMDADRQDSAEVKRTDDHVHVTAYTSSQDRKLELESHLSVLPLVSASVHLLSDAPAITPTATSVPVDVRLGEASAPPLFLKELIKQTGTLEIANRILSKQMDLLRRLRIELEALQDLNRRFPSEVRQGLPQGSLSRLDGLALDHLDAARQVWRELERNASPFLSATGTAELAGTANVSPKCSAWNRAEGVPANEAERLEDLYARAFTTLAGAPADISQDSIVAELPLLRTKLAAALAEGCLR
jgi:hypothetical protein